MAGRPKRCHLHNHKASLRYNMPGSSRPKEENARRISFMSKDTDPYAMLLHRIRAFDFKGNFTLETSSPQAHSSFESALNELYRSDKIAKQSDLGVHETLLLNLVRMRSSVAREAQDKANEPPKIRENESEDVKSETCNHHGFISRMTDRSISRSRFSRASTRRDMDIPSILAFTAMIPIPEAQPGLPTLQRAPAHNPQEIPKWSIRRSVCPVCSQKWKDRSSLANIRYSGLKRNSSLELPSVTAPARLKTSIAREYAPRPMSPEDRERSLSRSSFRNTTPSWQLVRARRLRIPKSMMQSEDMATPTSSALRARIDLEKRVRKFLTNNQESNQVHNI